MAASTSALVEVETTAAGASRTDGHDQGGGLARAGRPDDEDRALGAGEAGRERLSTRSRIGVVALPYIAAQPRAAPGSLRAWKAPLARAADGPSSCGPSALQADVAIWACRARALGSGHSLGSRAAKAS